MAIAVMLTRTTASRLLALGALVILAGCGSESECEGEECQFSPFEPEVVVSTQGFESTMPQVAVDAHFLKSSDFGTVTG